MSRYSASIALRCIRPSRYVLEGLDPETEMNGETARYWAFTFSSTDGYRPNTVLRAQGA